jgi:hypothetical protein
MELADAKLAEYSDLEIPRLSQTSHEVTLGFPEFNFALTIVEVK